MASAGTDDTSIENSIMCCGSRKEDISKVGNAKTDAEETSSGQRMDSEFSPSAHKVHMERKGHCVPETNQIDKVEKRPEGFPPTSMTFIQSSPDYKETWTACWLAHGGVATGGNGFIDIRDIQLNVTTSVDIDGLCLCVRHHPDDKKLVAMIYYQKQLTLMLYSLDLNAERTLIELASSGDDCHFSINSEHLVVPDSKSKLLRVHKTGSSLIDNLNIEDLAWPWGVHITKDSQHVLVSDCNARNSSVRKYKFGKSSPIWSCPIFSDCVGLCEGLAGDVYAASNSSISCCIHQISNETGELLRSMMCPALENVGYTYDVGVNDKMALIVASGSGVQMYKLGNA